MTVRLFFLGGGFLRGVHVKGCLGRAYQLWEFVESSRALGLYESVLSSLFALASASVCQPFSLIAWLLLPFLRGLRVSCCSDTRRPTYKPFVCLFSS